MTGQIGDNGRRWRGQARPVLEVTMRRQTSGLLSTSVSILGVALFAAACGGATTAPSATPVVTVPSPSAMPSTVAELPHELVHPWFRWTDKTTEWDRVGTWILLIETPTKVLHGDGGEATTRVLDADTLELVAASAAAGCAVGDTGTYDWSLSSSRRNLSLEPQGDRCAPRKADLEGDWILSDCPAYPDDFCLGALDPGSHVANFFVPLLPTSDEWQLDPAAMSYRVPDGWSNAYDSANEYLLEPLVKTGDTGVYMWTDVTIVSDELCTPRPWPEGRATPSEMAAWLAKQRTLETSSPVMAEVGGLEGLSLDVVVPAEATLPCTGDGVPYQPFLAHVEGSGLQWGFKKNTQNRLYFLDTGYGRTLVIHVAAAGENADRHLMDGIEIVKSIELRR